MEHQVCMIHGLTSVCPEWCQSRALAGLPVKPRPGRKRIYPPGYEAKASSVPVRDSALELVDRLKWMVFYATGKRVGRMVTVDLLLEHWCSNTPSQEQVMSYLK